MICPRLTDVDDSDSLALFLGLQQDSVSGKDVKRRPDDEQRMTFRNLEHFNQVLMLNITNLFIFFVFFSKSN
jgi:hypothetical protein